MALFGKTKQELQAALEKLEAAEDRIRDLEADFHTIEDSVALMVLSRDGLIERVSDEALTLLGHQRENLIGQHHRALCKNDYAGSEEYIVFWRELSIGRKQEGRFVNLGGVGREVGVDARYLPVLSEKGVVKRVIVLMRQPDVARD
jgi:methyl-accepting chemotaxis protein